MSSQPPAAEPLLYTRRQVAAMLGLCEKSIWSLTRDGKLPAVHVTSRAIRYDRRDVERFIENAKGIAAQAQTEEAHRAEMQRDTGHVAHRERGQA